ncbi:VWA domain-containing protein [Streptacidiphilus sp. EB129]|uniref:VWA domain-containing protein n=1 Tax=Streptacidiphilus sp. EB129 TaxID=3156262 RepID=UPI0035158252
MTSTAAATATAPNASTATDSTAAGPTATDPTATVSTTGASMATATDSTAVGPTATASTANAPTAGASPGSAPAGSASAGSADERLRRWRLVLGGDADGTGCRLVGREAAMDRALSALYRGDSGNGADRRSPRGAGLGGSAPQVARWLGDIREYFPTSVVQLMQQDAIERLGLARLLLEPEMLAAVEPDVHLVGTLISLGKALPETTRETARAVVRAVVTDLERRIATRTRSLVGGALDRSARVNRPRHRDIDWDRTIRANLRNYLPPEGERSHGTVVPERLVGYARAQHAVKKDVILCIDQSGSMAASVVHSSVFGAVLASMHSLHTRLVVFDTAVVDLTDQLTDPVDVLFGVQLGGGTDINRALAYCQSRITRPADTVVVLISDLYEGGIRDEMLKRVAAMKSAGVQFIALLALSDDGAPSYDRTHAAALAALGAPAFACTPDLFPEVMAAAIQKQPLPVPET